uniref:Uncharacterized protein n=1 Tax=Anopheles coluzzii TaxID=1518534 RepID=A0A8W7PN06_ANOCL
MRFRDWLSRNRVSTGRLRPRCRRKSTGCDDFCRLLAPCLSSVAEDPVPLLVPLPPPPVPPLLDAVRDLLLNLVRRCTLLPVLAAAAAPLAVPLPAGWLCWRAATNWLRMTGRGVVLVLSELPTSVPSSKISFRQLVVEVRIAFDRVGDGIVLYFGIVDAVTMLSVGIGIVIVELSVIILVVTSSPPPPAPPAMLRMH